ncbi:acyltransferase [Pseudoflavitalea sp. X16]|uniref:acyltransferase family protein n=1 Tax=Paraflavitalea devenefica TaxID=2716334 RepID=UPI001421477E|nr:acyltransferase [Paraflavitalea devenefica]NII23638.1 acyltransferase [Paraflavitalea devenefica]
MTLIQASTIPIPPATPVAKAKVFFPNLDGLRFISFLVVFLHHCYLSFFSYLQTSAPTAFKIQSFLFKYGTLGVNFFFVLSGFLITYLLIREKEVTGTIHIGNFYVRRILRIWPLYFLCLLIGFVGFAMLKKMSGELPQESANPWYYIFLIGNFDYMHTWPVKPDAILLSVLWSVCVEEQFYLAWPLILKFVPVRFYKYIFGTIILLSLIFRSFYTGNTEADHAVRYFHTFSLIGDMALGALLAWLVSFPNKFKDFITHLSKPAIVFIYIGALCVTLGKEFVFPYGIPIIFERLVIGIFFALIIAEQNFAHNSLFKMSRFKLVSKLGTYTYGLYCLHLLGMYAAVKVVVKLGWQEDKLWVAAASAVIGLLLSIAISIAAYHLFEKWFLKWKDKFAFITK